MKSGINLELKHRCEDFAPIRSLLRSINAKKVVVKKQKDFFFKLPPYEGAIVPRMKLRNEGARQTLIYYKRPDFSKQKGASAELALYAVSDKKLFPFLEHALGVKSVVEKKRELWKKGNAVFHLDVVKGVGDIFEIEIQKKTALTKRDKELFRYYADLFMPYLGNIVTGSNGD